ncbi:MAG: FAD-binding oxidoreductase [Metallosphaera prunae]|uniref:NAD(P)/FAD-dependent oxidoreductase n=1 Tax=Metallosphaera prunae TaxID=47304 RepID=UPI0022769EF9|nr:FAD-binding oxidoreductase [Metallosphaera prunae]MCY0862993.1 FAD-binding oxidoreductase [Metallosphaera prunae]
MNVGVVGGGIVGLMSAYFLAKEGASVTVYDPAPGKYSIHAAGLIEPYRFDRINTTSMIAKMFRFMRRGVTEVRQLNRMWVIELLSSLNKSPPQETWDLMREMARLSLDTYAQMAEERNDFDYHNDGLLEVYTSEEELEKGEKEEKQSPFSPKFEVTEVPGFAGGIFFPELSRIATEKFVKRITRELAQMKVNFQGMEAQPNLRDYTLNGEKFDVLILANGVWITKFLRLPITAFKGYGAWVKGSSKIKNAFVTVDEGVAVSPLSDHIKITGGFSADYGTEWRTDILSKVTSLVKVEEVMERNMGFRPCSPDGFPIMGRLENVVVATGACRLGWSYAPAMGYYASELALGKRKTLGYISRYVDRLRSSE